MSYAYRMLSTYSSDTDSDQQSTAQIIDALTDCAQACTACVDAGLSGDLSSLSDLPNTLRFLLDCADICETTARVLSRRTSYDTRISRLQAAAALAAVRACADALAEQTGAGDAFGLCERICRQMETLLEPMVSGRPGEAAVDLTAVESALERVTPRVERVGAGLPPVRG